MIYLYGIPNCDTVKKARVFLDKYKLTYDFMDFKKTPPTKESLVLWSKSFGELPVNKKGQTYKKHSAVYEKLSDEKKISFIIEHSSMIKRPILQEENKVLSFGFDEAEFKKVLGV